MEFGEIGMIPTPPSQVTNIEIYKPTFFSNDSDQGLDLENTKITKSSLAIWLWENGHEDLAKNVQSNISERINEKTTLFKGGLGQSTEIEEPPVFSKKPLNIRTPESSLIDSLGIMAWLLSEKSNKFKRSEKPNFKQIKDAVEAKIIDLGLNENEDNKIMVSNLNRDIKIAFDQLEIKLNSK
ncbi:MAG: hypothetical protein GY928_06880 [Colwellia sp.]|nr:hypothetical protein [Colwellia sp.]